MLLHGSVWKGCCKERFCFTVFGLKVLGSGAGGGGASGFLPRIWGVGR